MQSNFQFWMNWAVQAAAAVATLAAVVVALFGGWLLAHLMPPRLTLSLKDWRGFRAPYGGKGSFWYYVRAANKRRWPVATQVQVFLLSVEERDAAGMPRQTWAGELPIKWRDQEIYPAIRTIGRDGADCDLCTVVEGNGLELHPLIPRNTLNARRHEKCDLILTLQARAPEADSNRLRVLVAWDGGWADGVEEMTQHMTVRDVSDAKIEGAA
jgi:hypothetical protein